VPLKLAHGRRDVVGAPFHELQAMFAGTARRVYRLE
jgi:hypothetical protein